jgi:hypothetical protein
MDGTTFEPPVQAVVVTGMPGDIVSVSDFAGARRTYLPLILRD